MTTRRDFHRASIGALACLPGSSIHALGALGRLAPLTGAAGAAALVTATSSSQAATGTGPYQWRSVPFGGAGFVNGFVFHPREAGLLYARTDIGGLYRFDAVGQRWLPLLDHLGRDDADLMGVLSIALDPGNPDRVYAACGTYTGEWARKAALLTSNDRGLTWRTTELGIKLGGNEAGRGTGERLQVDPTDPRVLWLGTTRDGLMKSTDGGLSFKRVSFPGQHVSLVLIDPSTGSGNAPVLWVGCTDQPGLFVSRDGGASFSRETATPAQVPQRAALGPQGDLYISFTAGGPGEVPNPGYARTGSVWRRPPAGAWTEISPVKAGEQPLGFGYSGVAVDARAPGRLVVSTLERWGAGDELFLSTDHGASWTPLAARSRMDSSGWPWLDNFQQGRRRMGHWMADVQIDPFNGERAVYGTGYGVWMTGNLGAPQVQWAFTVKNLEETAALEIKSPSGGAALLAAMGDHAGGAWDDLDNTPRTGLFAPTSETNRSVDFAWLNPGVVARTSDAAATGGYLSLDGGASWSPFGPSPRATKTPQGWTAPAGRVAVSAKGGFLVWAPERQAAMWSRDRGRSWQLCEGWPTDRESTLEPVADRHVEGVFHVFDRANGTILSSVDGGRSFQIVVKGLAKLQAWQTAQLVAAPGAARHLWLALPQGLLHLPGAEQAPKAARLITEAWLVSVGKGAPGSAHHSVFVWGKANLGGQVSDGLFRSDDGGSTFVRVDDPRHRYGRLLSISADPLEHGTVFIAPHGRGVLVGRPA
ncbi:WD40/YVTN/BNR-like repeat-containing protein [Ideonella margarita]|uniref:BNR/Asp-box repeat protein n=1 Tax=Ideonella margarita TaxID=2984191 RepID=A0ABU9C061_9BURK